MCSLEAIAILKNDRSLRPYCRFRVLQFGLKILGIDIDTVALIAGERLDEGPYTKEELESFQRTGGFQNAFEC